MTSATIVDRWTQKMAEDNVMLTVTDNYTYVTRLGTIYGVHVTMNEDLGATARPISVSWSGRTITFRMQGIAAKKFFVTVKGKL